MIEQLIMIKKALVLVFLLLLASCGFFSKKVESLTSSFEKSDSSTRINRKNLHCPDNNKIQLILEDDSTIKFYRPVMSSLFEAKNYSFIQKAAMLSLIEMSRRPDKASPSARLQYFLRLNGKIFYFDFRPVNLDDGSKMPYLKGIEFLLKNFDTTKGLSKLAESLDQQIPQNINVTPEMEAFLQNNKNDLAKNETFAESFMKGDEVLTKHESFKRISYRKIVSIFFNDKLNTDTYYESSKNPLFPVNVGETDLELKCNTDISKENKFKDDLLYSPQNKSHYFALKDGENLFIAVSSAILEKPFKNYKNTYFFKTRVSPLPLPICQFRNVREDVVLFSTSGRNPEQHLKHLVTYDISLVDSFRTLEELLNFSRHLFLSNPDRILYESKRGRKSQLEFFLNMNFPIYHVDSIGDIIGSASFIYTGHKNQSLIVDDRSSAKLWCSP